MLTHRVAHPRELDLDQYLIWTDWPHGDFGQLEIIFDLVYHQGISLHLLFGNHFRRLRQSQALSESERQAIYGSVRIESVHFKATISGVRVYSTPHRRLDAFGAYSASRLGIMSPPWPLGRPPVRSGPSNFGPVRLGPSTSTPLKGPHAELHGLRHA